MDELFSNIFYLIPVALFIALRIMNAKKTEQKKQQQQQQKKISEELVKKIHEAQTNPTYGRALTEDTEVYIPSVVTQDGRQVLVKQLRKPAKTKKSSGAIQPKHAELKSSIQKTFMPEESFDSAVSRRQTPAENVSKTLAAKETKTLPAAQTTSGIQNIVSRPELTPLQQAVVWAEILGQPKGFS